MVMRLFKKDQQGNEDPSQAVLRTVMATFWLAGWFFIGPTSDEEWQRALMWVMHIAFGVLLIRALQHDASAQRVRRTLRAQTVIIIAGLLIQPENFSTLSPIVAMLAAMRMPRFWWVLWAITLGSINVVSTTYQIGYPDGTLDGLVQAAIIFAFATFAYSLDRAQLARAQTQSVLVDLREAHQRLQQYAQQVERLAIAEERGRISRDLHDTLGHRLTVSIVQLEGAGRLVTDQPERAAQMIETVREQLVEGLQDVRKTVSMLRTSTELESSFTDAIAELTEDFTRATRLPVTVIGGLHLPPLPETRRQALYLATQEALTNIQRHAHATKATITIDHDIATSETSVRIEDDGKGMTSESIANGFGLRGMRERIESLGGTVAIDSAIDNGTRVSVSLQTGAPSDPA